MINENLIENSNTKVLEVDALHEEMEKDSTTFEINDKTYALAYSMNRLKQIEAALGEGLMALVRRSGAMFSLGQIEVLVGFGMKEVGGTYQAPKKAAEWAGNLLEKLGYSKVCGLIYEALERDLGFLFQTD